MEGSIRVTRADRKTLLKLCRSGENVRTARYAQVILLRSKGWTWEKIREASFCSNDLIRAALKTYESQGVAGLTKPVTPQVVPLWLVIVIRWITKRTPHDFGYFRTRWTCSVLAELLSWEKGIRVGRETIRRSLHQAGYVWRRPRPVIGPDDPRYKGKLRKIRDLLASLPSDETAVFQDEVDVNLNPKIGSAWMKRGQQDTVETPGNNVKRYIFGSLNWRTGKLIVSSASLRRNSAEFIRHLDDLRTRMKGWTHIHVICDNASFHDSRAVQKYLKQWSHRLTIHFLPCYAPETNPIERVWWHMHETVTRNHKCQSIEELLDNVYNWFARKKSFDIENKVNYPIAA